MSKHNQTIRNDLNSLNDMKAADLFVRSVRALRGVVRLRILLLSRRRCCSVSFSASVRSCSDSFNATSSISSISCGKYYKNINVCFLNHWLISSKIPGNNELIAATEGTVLLYANLPLLVIPCQRLRVNFL